MLCDDLSRFKEDPTLLLVFILHMSDEWQAIRFCLLFSETRSGIFPADRRKPNEFFAELINWHSEGCFLPACHVYRHMLVPVQVYMSFLYLYIYICMFWEACVHLQSAPQWKAVAFPTAGAVPCTLAEDPIFPNRIGISSCLLSFLGQQGPVVLIQHKVLMDDQGGHDLGSCFHFIPDIKYLGERKTPLQSQPLPSR